MELKNYIKVLNQKFQDEAINSPQLMADMSMMEKYMAESYSERILIELIQNADDSCSKKIKLIIDDEFVIFANDGRVFNEDDINAISRSGSSNKKRGNSIGYRGVGFKSSTAISKEIVIYSDNTYFTFSKSLCANKLNLNERDIPTIRIPFLIDESEVTSQMLGYKKKLLEEGYTTIFFFKTSFQEKIIEEARNLSNSDFMFLRNVSLFDIYNTNYKRKLEISRDQKEKYKLVKLSDGINDNNWIIYYGKEIEFAFKLLTNDKVIPCERNESVFHSFLPTIENNCFAFKINADFSTDPSRKHLLFDDRTNSLIEDAAVQLVEILNEIDSNYKNVFNLFQNSLSYSKAAILFQKAFDKEISKKMKILLNTEECICITEYKIFETWLEPNEILELRNFSIFIHDMSSLDNVVSDNFIRKYSKKKYGYSDFIQVLSDKSLIENISIILLSKIYAFILEHIAEKKLDINIELKDCYIRSEDSIIKISDITLNNVLNRKLSICLEGLLSNSALNHSKKIFNFFVEKETASKTNEGFLIDKSFVNVNNKTISKWKTSEEQCASFEEMLGNQAVVVANKNLGYDVESITPEGEKRYIEVKSLDNYKSSFSITNNEYTSAHLNKNNYYLALVNQTSDSLKIIYIQNPIETIELEKRVKNWEWFCEKYSGEEYTVGLNN